MTIRFLLTTMTDQARECRDHRSDSFKNEKKYPNWYDILRNWDDIILNWDDSPGGWSQARPRIGPFPKR